MKRFFLKQGLIAGIYFFGAIVIEIATFLILGFGVFPTYPLFDICIMLGISAILFFIPSSIASTCVAGVLLLLQTAIGIANSSLYPLYGDILNADHFALIGLAGNTLNAHGSEAMAFFNWGEIAIFVAIFALALAAMIIITVKIKERVKFKDKSYLSMAMLFVALVSLAPSAFYIQKAFLPINENVEKAVWTRTFSDKYLYEDLSNKNAYFIKFGSFSFYFRNLLLGEKPEYATNLLADNDVAEYFSTQVSTPSDYFEIDKGNNLIVIMLETGDSVFLNKRTAKYLPTLSGFMTNGINLENYHAQAKTDYSETSGILGSYPQLMNPFDVKDWTEELKDDYFSKSLVNMLKNEAGYETATYMHLEASKNYNRDKTHTEYYGFDRTVFYDSTPAEKAKYIGANGGDVNAYGGWNLPEKWFLEGNIDTFLPQQEKPFISWISTINAHVAWDETPYNKAFYDLIDDADFADIAGEEWYEDWKWGVAEMMVVDDGIKYLKDELIARGLYEETTILFYADHNAFSFGLVNEYKNADNLNPKVYNLPAFIWSQSIEDNQTIERNITKFTGTFDLTVSILDLLGVSYNPAFYLGNNIFAPETSVVISHSGGIFNDKFFCYDIGNLLYATENATERDRDNFYADYTEMVKKWVCLDRYFNDRLK
ncbi:MAG: sulfatase-like hydrolase/transferase [Christensenellaceae bacterium]|jgi:hypothetical protein|nr:sulfatase-like hydrolase/transferase [Christensenellaceae bacterium]